MADPTTSFCAGMECGLAILDDLVAGTPTMPGKRAALDVVERAAFALIEPAPAGKQDPVARRIARHLDECHGSAPGNPAFELGVHAATFVGMELANRATTPREFRRALDEAEDVASLARVRRFSWGSNGLADGILCELERRRTWTTDDEPNRR